LGRSSHPERTSEARLRGVRDHRVALRPTLPRAQPDPDLLKRWITFLRNHKHAIAGMDLFTVPTATLNVLYGFFVIHHDRRRILHFNATYNPTAQWVMQQLREAFPFDSAPRHIIFDRDSIFCPAVVRFVRSLA